MAHISVWGLLSIALLCFLTIPSIQVAGESIPSESECRPYIEKALNTAKTDAIDNESPRPDTLANDDKSQADSDENVDLDSNDATVSDENDVSEENGDVAQAGDDDGVDSKENADDDSTEQQDTDSKETADGDSQEQANVDSKENTDDDSKEQPSVDSKENDDVDSAEQPAGDSKEGDSQEQVSDDAKEDDDDDSKEEADGGANGNTEGDADGSAEDAADDDSQEQQVTDSKEGDSQEQPDAESTEDADGNSKEQPAADSKENESQEQKDDNSEENTDGDDGDSKEQQDDGVNENADDDSKEQPAAESNEDDSQESEAAEPEVRVVREATVNAEPSTEDDDSAEDDDAVESNEVSTKSYPVDDLLMETEVPENRRDRSHIDEILRLDEDSFAENEALQKTAEVTLNNLKKIYENAIKPLETLYKYRDLSNRHFGDSEVFSKPLVLFMGPWSGGKSSILNYLTDNEYTEHSLRTGAEPSPAYFNILMHGDSPEVLDGTQLAADWTFSGLQKFGQGLQDRLRGLKLPSNILKKVNIVEIPGILEVRKQVSRVFPFNDACQWFIDRADIIFLVYDPSKLDVGPETEAILDQLKGREYQTRILLNKADTIHPEELLRVQSALIWNISPLMSSAQPPVMYTTSLWSNPYQDNAPIRLLQAQERALLQDLSQAIEHRIENKIASARRFAVRVRNHAKMVDCYLTTYYNHKTLFGNKKKISGEIVEHPQNYHIYEGLSTLTNISRYDLPDPDVYRDFFRLNPLYEFKKLSETCTYFRGCPINKLDVAIAYDLPELVNRYKRAKEQALITLELGTANDTTTTSTAKR